MTTDWPVLVHGALRALLPAALPFWFQSTFVAGGMVCNVDPANAQFIYAEWQSGSLARGGHSWPGRVGNRSRNRPPAPIFESRGAE